jgi:hypothetical protein
MQKRHTLCELLPQSRNLCHLQLVFFLDDSWATAPAYDVQLILLSLPNLVRLQLEGCGSSDGDFEDLEEHANLQELSIGCSDPRLFRLWERCPRVKSLELWGLDSVNPIRHYDDDAGTPSRLMHG